MLFSKHAMYVRICQQLQYIVMILPATVPDYIIVIENGKRIDNQTVVMKF